MKKTIILSFITFLFVACSPQKRLNRIIKNNPGLLQVNDTIVYRDTLTTFVPGIKTDTVVHISSMHDTVFLSKDFIHVKTYIKGDSIYIEAATDPITKTIYIEKRIPVTRYVAETKKINLDWLIILILFGTVVYLFLKK